MIRPATMLSIIAVCAVGYGMFQVKYQVMQLEDQLQHVRHQTALARDNIRVLNAEWSLLNQPARIDALAKRFLDLKPVTNATLGQLDTLPERPSATPMAGATPAVPPATEVTAAAAKTTTRTKGLRGAQVATYKIGAER
jgi:cell division protein FtsL